jgi:hypothetical protein
VRLPRIPNERWHVMNLPEFKNRASCAGDTRPNDWFPEFDSNVMLPSRKDARNRYSYTPSALRARSVCLNCDAFDECLEYSLQWTDLEGIWANLDTYERKEEQRVRGIQTTSLTFSYDNPLDIARPQVIESEWDNV